MVLIGLIYPNASLCEDSPTKWVSRVPQVGEEICDGIGVLRVTRVCHATIDFEDCSDPSIIPSDLIVAYCEMGFLEAEE